MTCEPGQTGLCWSAGRHGTAILLNFPKGPRQGRQQELSVYMEGGGWPPCRCMETAQEPVLRGGSLQSLSSLARCFTASLMPSSFEDSRGTALPLVRTAMLSTAVAGFSLGILRGL